MEKISYLNGRVICEVKDNGCHEVISHKQGANGYPQIRYNGIASTIHRVVYMFEILGVLKLDGTMDICHTCDNRKCCNTEHLFSGTRQDNVSDMVEKGRNSTGKKHGDTCRGEIQGNSKLTEIEVKLIRLKYELGKRKCDLAEEYNVSHKLIRNIINYKTWTHV